MHDVVGADYEAVEAAISSEPQTSNDARIAKLVLDGGPGTVARIYCLEGIWGEIKLEAAPERASLRVRAPHPEGTAVIAVDNSEFDGQFKLSHSAQQLILTVVPINPAATIDIDQSCHNVDLPYNHISLSPNADTHVTVTARSEDGTQRSSFDITIDRALCPISEPGTA